MARMIPVSLEQQDNIGENKVFEALQKMPKNWVVRSNLRCSFVTMSHSRHLEEVESDFVVLIPKKGLVFLEVKSSLKFSCSQYGKCQTTEPINYECKDAIWKRITRTSEVETRNPFAQVWDAKNKQMRALSMYLYGTEDYKSKFPGVYAHLVVYPQGKIKEGGQVPLQAPCVVVTSKDMPDLEQKINDIVDLYPGASLDDATFKKIVNYFEEEVHIEAISTDPDTLEMELAKLTEKQKEIAQDLLAKDDNYIVYGCCGSGKTMLAVWLLKHKAAQGKKVLYLCYNRMLAATLRLKLGPNYEIKTIQQLIASLAKQAQLPYEQHRIDEIFAMACETLESESQLPKYDVIIIDEAQDIRSEDQFLELNNLVGKGGRIYLFADPMQDVYHSNAAEENHKAPKKPFYEDLWDAREITLDKNCRNTKKVAEYVKEIKETNTSVFEEAPQGIYPQILLPTKQPEKSLEKIVNNILTSREYPWPASSIAILVMGRNDLESLENQTFHGNIGTAVYDSEKRNEEEVLTQWCSSKKILVSTIHSFKGLEADIIILYNFDSKFQSNDEKIDTLAYVGSSRPHGALYIIPKDSISRAYVESFLQHQDKSL